jgi:hypothetical protein
MMLSSNQFIGPEEEHMGLSLEEVKRIKKEFAKDVIAKAPFAETVSCLGISWVGHHDPAATPEQAKDHCISVGLVVPLPDGVSLPTEYQGVKVFSRVIGQIRAC